MDAEISPVSMRKPSSQSSIVSLMVSSGVWLRTRRPCQSMGNCPTEEEK